MRIDFRLPEVIVGFCDEAVVDAGEFSVGAPGLGLDAGVCRGFGVECPAAGWGGEVVAFGKVGGGLVVRWKPEENIAVGDGEVDDDIAGGVFVTAGYVSMETWR